MNNIVPKQMENKTTQPKKTKKKTPRCHLAGCKKKIKITDMKCPCGHIFCTIHRLKINHNCSIEAPNKDEFMIRCGLGGGKIKKIEVL